MGSGLLVIWKSAVLEFDALVKLLPILSQASPSSKSRRNKWIFVWFSPEVVGSTGTPSNKPLLLKSRVSCKREKGPNWSGPRLWDVGGGVLIRGKRIIRHLKALELIYRLRPLSTSWAKNPQNGTVAEMASFRPPFGPRGSVPSLFGIFSTESVSTFNFL